MYLSKKKMMTSNVLSLLGLKKWPSEVVNPVSNKVIEVAPTSFQVILSVDRIKLRKYQTVQGPSLPPILVIPSITKRPELYDLFSGGSLIEFLCNTGRRTVYLLDWGVPNGKDAHKPPERYVRDYIDICLKEIQKEKSIRRIHLLGKCLGGTLALIYSFLRPHNIETLTLLSSPIDFSKRNVLTTLSCWEGLDLCLLEKAYENTPWWIMHFQYKLSKLSTSVSRLENIVRYHNHASFWDELVSLEKWYSDHVDIPCQFFRFMIESLYRKNELVKNKLIVGGEKVDISQVSFPINIYGSSGDHITPLESSLALDQSAILDTKMVRKKIFTGGHISGFLGENAQKLMWPEILRGVNRKRSDYD